MMMNAPGGAGSQFDSLSGPGESRCRYGSGFFALDKEPIVLVDDTSSLAHRCRLREGESIPLVLGESDDGLDRLLLGRKR